MKSIFILLLKWFNLRFGKFSWNTNFRFFLNAFWNNPLTLKCLLPSTQNKHLSFFYMFLGPSGVWSPSQALLELMTPVLQKTKRSHLQRLMEKKVGLKTFTSRKQICTVHAQASEDCASTLKGQQSSNSQRMNPHSEIVLKIYTLW